MRNVNRILVIQTAFIGDVILTLPLVQVLKECFPSAKVDMISVPRSSEVCRNHPALGEVIEFDKRGKDRGLSGLRSLAARLKEKQYDLAVVPHRSLRSAFLAWLSRIPLRIGFDRSAGRFLFTKTVKYRPDLHEIERNLSLLEAVGVREAGRVLPRVYPDTADQSVVDRVLADAGQRGSRELIAIAPGTVWNTKRWFPDRFSMVAASFMQEGFGIVLVGGKEDEGLCEDIVREGGGKGIINMAGKLTLLQSAELIRRCRALISNDSAPMHLAVAVGTPVVAIFGATDPAFGFGPAGPKDVVVETLGLSCRPCSIHGGDRCPIQTFVCMKDITHDRVLVKAKQVLEAARVRA